MIETYWLIAISLVVVVLAVQLVVLRRDNRGLKQKITELSQTQNAIQKDLQLICAAAVAVDQQLADNGVRISTVMESVKQPQQPVVSKQRPSNQVSPILHDTKKPDSQPTQEGYDVAIEHIRQGADIESLVRDYGLSKDEAVLLIRLHGPR